MTARSAGLLVFRRTAGSGTAAVEVLIGHLGGPLWAKKDARAWTVPKGLVEAGEDERTAARREFGEETGLAVPDGEWIPLGEVRLKSAKVVSLWAVEGDVDAGAAVSNLFTMQWPPRSGQQQEFPELDRCAWVSVERARDLLSAGQVPFLDRLLAALR